MLDSETKRKIDSARNVLVGNVTNPISQVDQITNALIYKFMDDMDQENLEVDLKPQFFVGDYEKYSWTKLMDKKLSGQERLDFYIQAITNMSKNPHIPQLFRDIFKGAFLPYNDPRVLNLFLKEIDGFSYNHSEELGNAFEYLLSILGSQGDAGQFRTPRHIIDFITEVVDPKKNETILDPACGTAGFLISAYKHILKSHDGLDNKTGKPTNKEKNLTPNEKTKLMNNIVGYDISPDMVKLSLVNMYLHGFQNPQIHKYDTLSSDKRWGETYDVIMANPPFMSPKGGIQPHKKFSIQANRAEVLFVDYIMEHLSIKGRAGIIVPEGIVFKSDKAYKALRKKLVEDGLFAVVSLPAGVFNPYAGVKTSILFFDNSVAKQSDEILFIKVLNDGFDLGAQRRARPDLHNDLFDKGGALDVLKAQAIAIQTGNKNTLANDKSLFAWTVKKEKISENGDYNLSGDRYKETEINKNQKWEMVELGKVCELFVDGDWIESKDQAKSGIRLIQTGNIGVSLYLDKKDKARFINEKTFKKLSCTEVFPGDILISRLPDPVGRACIMPKMDMRMITSVDCTIVRTKSTKILPLFLLYLTKGKNYKNQISKYLTGSSRKRISRKNLEKIKIPLPPLEVQKEIVEQIEVKQNAINHAKEIIKNLERERRYFGQELRKLEDVEIVELGEISKLMTGGTPKSTEKEYYGGNIKWLVSGDIHKKEIYDCEGRVTEEGLNNSNAKILPINSVLIALNGQGKTRGTVAILKTKAACNQSLVSIDPDNTKMIPEFLLLVLQSKYQDIRNINGDNQRGGLNMPIIRKIKIPVPSINVQKQFVSETEKEEEIITANKKLIEIMESKIEKVISEI